MEQSEKQVLCISPQCGRMPCTMTTYKSLYHLMVRSMSEAIDLYDEGKGILAREVLKKALLDAEEQVITHDIIPDEPIGSTDSAEN